MLMLEILGAIFVIVASRSVFKMICDYCAAQKLSIYDCVSAITKKAAYLVMWISGTIVLLGGGYWTVEQIPNKIWSQIAMFAIAAGIFLPFKVGFEYLKFRKKQPVRQGRAA